VRVSDAARVVDLEEWRQRHVVKDASAGDPLPFNWGSLAMAGDARDFVSRYTRLGLHAILIHGLNDGSCTCGRSDCTAIGKHPVHPGWQRAELDAQALDAALEREWHFNIGLRMGRQPSGETLVAIDVDGDRELLDPIEHEHGALPRTLTAATARGLHLIFRVPPGRVIRNRVRLAPGVDVRAEGGQIVVAPSRHQSGARYRWIDCRAPELLT
jgi:hypothetical protein